MKFSGWLRRHRALGAAVIVTGALACSDTMTMTEPSSAEIPGPTFALGAGAGMTQVSGVGVFDGTACPAPPTGYDDFTSYPGIAMTGDLVGCWYTKVLTSKDNGSPSGVYQERGEEVFIGSLNGGPAGTFATTYHFTSQWEPDVSTGSEVRGRCQHPIVEGSGTGGFEGATGRIDFKDDVAAGTLPWRGHISLRGASSSRIQAAALDAFRVPGGC